MLSLFHFSEEELKTNYYQFLLARYKHTINYMITILHLAITPFTEHRVFQFTI